MTDSARKQKINFSLDREIVRTLDDYALILGCPRSKVLNDILSKALPEMKTMMEAFASVKSGVGSHSDIAEIFIANHTKALDAYDRINSKKD